MSPTVYQILIHEHVIIIEHVLLLITETLLEDSAEVRNDIFVNLDKIFHESFPRYSMVLMSLID